MYQLFVTMYVNTSSYSSWTGLTHLKLFFGGGITSSVKYRWQCLSLKSREIVSPKTTREIITLVHPLKKHRPPALQKNPSNEYFLSIIKNARSKCMRQVVQQVHFFYFFIISFITLIWSLWNFFWKTRTTSTFFPHTSK